MTSPKNSMTARMATGLLKAEATMSSVAVTDLYEAAYFILSGCTLEEVSCIPVSESLSCRMLFSGTGLEKAQDEFVAKKALVNLHAFRAAYAQVNSFVHQAKKSFDRERRLARRGVDDGGRA
mgnify:FL=1